MTNDATSTSAPPASPAAPRYSQSLHVLVDEPTRAAVMGLAVLAARQAGNSVRAKEGESIRTLLESQLEHLREQAPNLYVTALAEGRAELAVRAAASRPAPLAPRRARRKA